MKKIIPLFILISFNSCITSDPSINGEIDTLTFSIKDKRLGRFFYGNGYYGLKGLHYKDSTSEMSLKRYKSLLRLDLKNKFISGFTEGVLLDKSLELYIHDLNIIRTKKIKIEFNTYKNKEFYFFPLINRENLEILKNRSSQLFVLNENFKLQSIYSSDEYHHKDFIDLSEVVFHRSTALNFENLKSLGLSPQDFQSFIFVHNPLTGLFTCLPLLENFTDKKSNILEELESKIIYENKEISEDKEVLNFNGNYIFNEDLLIDNKIVKISAGSVFKLIDNARIIFNNSSVEFNGNQIEKIKFLAEGDNSLLFSNSEIKIVHSFFSNFSRFLNRQISLPSAITFYNSTVSIENSIFKNNLNGDDLINFYNCEFEFLDSFVSESLSDAIDSDFSKGKVENLTFTNIGNDALDFSGSSVNIDRCSFTNVFDKAVSAGESSFVNLSNSYISESELAIVVKDGSELTSYNNILKDNRVNYAVFFKKDFYDVPTLTVDTLNRNEINLFQRGVKIKHKNFFDLEYLDDVESLLYGTIYGKASK